MGFNSGFKGLNCMFYVSQQSSNSTHLHYWQGCFCSFVIEKLPTICVTLHNLITRWGSFVINSSAEQPSTCHKPNFFHSTQAVTHSSGTSKAMRSTCPITGQDRPLGFQEGEAPRISRQLAHEGGDVVGPMHLPPLPPWRYPWYSFLLGNESNPGP